MKCLDRNKGAPNNVDPDEDDALVALRLEVADLRTALSAGHYFLQAKHASLARIVRFCEKTGAQLSSVLDQVDSIIEDLQELDTLSQKALAPARAALKILRILPLVALSMGFLFGVNPFHVFTTLPGAICLWVGLSLWALGKRKIAQMVSEFEGLGEHNFLEYPALRLTLVRAALLAGGDIVSALEQLQIEGVDALADGLPFSVAELPAEMNCLEDAYRFGHSPTGVLNARISTYKSAHLTLRRGC